MAKHPADPTDVDEAVADEQFDESGGIAWLRLVTAIVMATVIALFGAWATLNLGIAGPVAAVLFFVSAYWLYKKPIPSAVVGSGLYVTALLMLLTPVGFYVPTILSGNADSAEAAGAFIGGILGLFIWGLVFAVGAVVVAAVGYFAKKRARRKLSDSEPTAEAV